MALPSLKSLSLRPKLMVAFASMAILAGACGAVGLAYLGRINAAVTAFGDVTSPLLSETMALIDNALQMRSTIFRDLNERRPVDQLPQRLTQLDADGDRHIQNLHNLAARAQIKVPLDGVERSKRQYVETFERLIQHSRQREQSFHIAKARLEDFNATQQALRVRILDVINAAESKLSAGEDSAKVGVQAGTATVEWLGELMSRLLNEVYPVHQGANKLLQQVETVDEMTKLMMAANEPDELSAVEQRTTAIFRTINAMLSRIGGRMRGPEGKAVVTEIRNGISQLRTTVLDTNSLLASRRDELSAEADIAKDRTALAGIERAYLDLLGEIDSAVRGLNADAKERNERTIARARSVVAGSIAFAILAGLLFGHSFASRITSPLAHLTDHVVGIRRRGELAEFTEAETIARTDEIGTLARSFNLMIGELADARKRLITWSEQEITKQYERLNAAVNNMPQGLCMFDEHQRLIVCNRPYAEIYGLSDEETKPGTPLRDILEARVAQGGCPDNDGEYIGNRLKAVSEHKPFYVVNELQDGHVVAISHTPMPNGGSIATHEDITERRRAEAKIAFLAHHDALTQLPNRVSFREEMNKALVRIERGETLAVLCLDLDHFKEVNDTLGHPIGDALLQAVAGRIRGILRTTDTVARLGGDEFAFVQVAANQPSEATALANRLIKQIGDPFEIAGHQIVIGASVGVSVAPNDGKNPDDLLKNADMALYRAKEDGRGVCRFFEPEMDAKMQSRRALELDLRKALALNEFELHYQPLISVQDDRISGFEALLRWRHPQRGQVSPESFIPLAEDIGLIGQIGAWVLKQACRDAKAWPDDVSVAVNFSPVQFNGNTVILDVIAALGEAGLPAHRLEVEITEAVLLQETESTIKTLTQLRDLGVRIAMDDFGTGYSSLGYLRKFPFDKIKIDQSFIRDLSDKPASLAIVRAVTGIGSSLGMCTTAEGVETAEQLQRLRAEGCTEVQGYLFSEPRPARDLAALLAERGHAPGSANAA